MEDGGECFGPSLPLTITPSLHVFTAHTITVMFDVFHQVIARLPCNTVLPRYLVVCLLQVGDWSPCSGEEVFGHTSRDVVCVDSAGTTPSSGGRACQGKQPAASAVCARQAAAAVCTPSFILETLYEAQECWGHGVCTMTGCSCRDGWHGQFCEVSGHSKIGAYCCSTPLLLAETCADQAALELDGLLPSPVILSLCCVSRFHQVAQV
jgi:hypothetical protein